MSNAHNIHFPEALHLPESLHFPESLHLADALHDAHDRAMPQLTKLAGNAQAKLGSVKNAIVDATPSHHKSRRVRTGRKACAFMALMTLVALVTVIANKFVRRSHLNSKTTDDSLSNETTHPHVLPQDESNVS